MRSFITFQTRTGQQSPVSDSRMDPSRKSRMMKRSIILQKPCSPRRNHCIYGFGSTNCEGMSAVARVAEKAGAVLDNCASICHGPSFLAIFDNGYPSCTLGEVKNRADVVVFWGAIRCTPTPATPPGIRSSPEGSSPRKDRCSGLLSR